MKAFYEVTTRRERQAHHSSPRSPTFPKLHSQPADTIWCYVCKRLNQSEGLPGRVADLWQDPGHPSGALLGAIGLPCPDQVPPMNRRVTDLII